MSESFNAAAKVLPGSAPVTSEIKVKTPADTALEPASIAATISPRSFEFTSPPHWVYGGTTAPVNRECKIGAKGENHCNCKYLRLSRRSGRGTSVSFFDNSAFITE